MHTHSLDVDINLEELSKIEGAASCDIKVRNGQVTECKFAITEMRRFFEEAIRGKPLAAVPGQVARVCGTCSNAHLLASLKAIENALGIEITPQVKLLRELLNFGLIIRDHALHLYVFSLPDVFAKDSILNFDENNPEEHRLLDDCFAVKNAGNLLSIATGGRSVHAPLPRVGGFIKIPTRDELTKLIPVLEGIRPAILHLIDVFINSPYKLMRLLRYIAIVNTDYSFLNGAITTSDGEEISPDKWASQMSPAGITYSQADGYRFHNQTYMVGALARINLNEKALHPKTRESAFEQLKLLPSGNIFYNNVAQAIEILHAIDKSIDLINCYQANTETPPEIKSKAGIGYGVIEAPRGTLYHEVEVGEDGLVKHGRIIVPTAQNQVGIEESVKQYVEENLDLPKDKLEIGIEAVIRAYDPCMSCATHFLKVKWD